MEPEKIYHLYTHANGFENLFRCEENYRYFLKRYEHFILPVADTLAYCLMPNHIHFLIRIKAEAEIESAFKLHQHQTSEVFRNLGGLSPVEKRISKQFSNLFNSYTKAYNKMYSRKGSLFIPNFKRKEITSDSHFTKIIHYIHANPVHHGFVKEIAGWAWSSFHTILNSEPSLVKHEEIIQWFSSREEFLKYHQQPINIKTKQEIELNTSVP